MNTLGVKHLQVRARNVLVRAQRLIQERMMKKRHFVILTLFSAMLSSTAFADTYYVSVWNGLADCSGGAACLFDADKADAPVPASAPLATFEFVPDDPATGISWGTGSGTFNTYGDFLDKGTIDEYSGSVDLTTFLSTQMSVEGNRFASYFTVTGVYNADADFTRTILHDDGASLYVDNLSIFSAPARVTGQATAGPYSFAQGTHSFTLYYVAADGGPALLNLALPDVGTAVPEPATLSLLAMALLALGFSGSGLRRSANASTRQH